MDQKLCELCSAEAKLVCFCRKALLCEKCIGKHFLDEPLHPHKPIALSQTDMAKIYEENLSELRNGEDRLIEESQLQQELAKTRQSKIAGAIETLTDAEARIDSMLTALADSLCEEVRETTEKLKSELQEKNDEQIKVLRDAARTLQDADSHNPVVRALTERKTVAETQGLELVKWKLETDEIHVAELVRKAVRFSVDLPTPHKLPHAKTLDPKRLQPDTPPQKPRTPAPSKKTVKPDPRSPHVPPTKSQATLAQPKAPTSDRKQPQGRLIAPKKDNYGRRSTAFDFAPVSLLPDLDEKDIMSDEDFNLLAEENEDKLAASPGAMTARDAVNRRVKDSPARSTHAKSPPNAKGRPSIHKETEAKSKRRASDHFVMPRAGTEAKCDEEPIDSKPKSRLAPPTVSVTSPEGDTHTRTPRKSISDDSTRQLVTISKATEVSRSPTQFSPGHTPPKNCEPAFPQQTYIIPPGGKVIKVLDLDANTTAVKEFSLPHSEQFGADLAWCCSLYGEVFLLGGRAGEEALSSIYFYNPGTDELEGGCSMMLARYRHCVLYHQDSIYIFGGVGTTGTPMKDCELFDIRKKAHKRIGAMTYPRASHSACIHEGKIYVCGGDYSEFMEMMIPQVNSFSVIHLKVAITGPSALFPEGDKLVVIHSNLVTHFWPHDRSAKDVGRLSGCDWWCQGPAVAANGLVYFVKQSTAFRFDSQRVEMEELTDV